MSQLNTIFHQFEATLTAEQRLAVRTRGQLTNLTPQQIALLERMRPFLEGLTPEQCAMRGVQDTMKEGLEGGQKAANEMMRPVVVGAVVLGVVMALLFLLSR